MKKPNMKDQVAKVSNLIAGVIADDKDITLDAGEDELHLTFENFVSDEDGARRVQTTLIVTDLVEEYD